MKQLKMWFDPAHDTVPAPGQLPAGFVLRDFRAGDEAEYRRLREAAGFCPWTAEELAVYLPATIRVRVVEETASGRLVAAASAENTSSGMKQLGWVMCDPAFRGRKFGKLVVIAAMEILAASEGRSFLLTDDWRLSAIAVYLKLSWHPWLYETDMAERWDAVAEKLGFRFTSA